jgi:cell division control protein 7
VVLFPDIHNFLLSSGRTIATNVPDLDQDGISWQEFVERLNPDIWQPRKYDMRFYPHNTKHRDGRGSTVALQPPLSSSPTSTTTDDGLSALAALHEQEAGQRHQRQLEEQQQHAEKYMNPPSLERHSKEMKQAFHLLETVLHFESTKRFTPRKALYHPFLEEAGSLEDDAYVPHTPGNGVCRELHNINDEGKHEVRVMKRCSCRKQGGVHDEDDVFGHDPGPETEDVDDDEWCGVMVSEDIEVEAGHGIAIGDNACEYHRNMAFE